MPADLLDRLPDLEREAVEHERKARALRQIIEGVRELNGEASRLFGGGNVTRKNQYDPSEGPRGREAVRQIVADRPGVWRVLEIKAEVKRRGWPSSEAAIDTAVKRMESAGEATRIGKGTYRFETDAAVSQETGAADSDVVRPFVPMRLDGHSEAS